MAEFAFAFLDCEFGGLDPELHDITEIARDRHRLPPRRARRRRVEGARAAGAHQRRRRPRLQGYDAEVWSREAVPLRQALSELAALLPKGKTVVPAGQNVRMDVQFLERGVREVRDPWPFDYHVIDLATLYYAWSLVAGETVPALSLRQAATAAAS